MPSSSLSRPHQQARLRHLLRLAESPATAVVATVLVHALLLAWLLQAGKPRVQSVQDSIQVEWLSAEPPLLEIPPMPQAPSRRVTPSLRALRPALSSPTLGLPPTAANTSAPAPDPAAPAAGRLIDRIGAQLQDSGRITGPAESNPMDRTGPRLPGRSEAFVEGIRVPQESTPAGMVAMVGKLLFGATGGATCGDLRRKMASDISDAERRKLIHDERKICRRGEPGTYR